MFLDVGLFKEQAFVQSLPVDATLALGVLLATVCAMRVATGRVRPVPFGFALTITIVGLSLAVSLAWTPAAAYGGEKTTTFLTVTMLAIGAPFFLFERVDDLRRFFMWIVVVAVPVAFLALTHPSGETGRLAGDNTIGTSRLLCTAALILLLSAVGRSRWRLPPVALAVGFIAIAAAVGSRGPILALVLALAFGLAAWLLRVPRKVAPVLAVAAVSLAVVPFVSLPAASGERLASAARDPVAAFARTTATSSSMTSSRSSRAIRSVVAGRARSARSVRRYGRTTCSSSSGPNSASWQWSPWRPQSSSRS